jgi:hypothetical protein
MWVKGIILGLSFFVIGVFVFLFAAIRMRGSVLTGPGQAYSIDVRTIEFMTTQNVWFWIAGVACIALGLAVAASWPGRFSPVFWILVALADVVPVGLLTLFCVMLSRMRALAGK